jgi:N6-adenosine-specific RNA methylase IME4
MVTRTYNLLYVDPPWAYNPRHNQNTKFGGGAMAHYPVMPMTEIAALDLGKLAADNCALFLWCTFPKLDQQIQLFRTWGFRYATQAFTWVKTNLRNGAPFFGPGYYTASNTEVCLLGIKGRMKPVDNTVSSLVIQPRQQHGKKPNVVRQRIVQLFGDLPRAELFAREVAPGWDAFGNEIDGMDLREYLRKDTGV